MCILCVVPYSLQACTVVGCLYCSIFNYILDTGGAVNKYVETFLCPHRKTTNDVVLLTEALDYDAQIGRFGMQLQTQCYVTVLYLLHRSYCFNSLSSFLLTDMLIC